jgi:flagellar assembly protein FliH
MEAKVISGAPPAQGKRMLEGRPRPETRLAPPVQEAPAAIPTAAQLAAARERDIAQAVEAMRAEISARMAAEREGELDDARLLARDAGWKEGHEAGLEEGRAAGLEEARAASAERLARLDAVIESIERCHGAALQGTQEDAVAVGFAAACRILGEQLVTPEGVRAAVLEVIARAHAADRVMVRLHPGDLARIARLDDAGRHEGRSVEFVADDAVPEGGCRVETTAGSFEARLDRRIEAMRDALLAARTVDRAAG